MKTAVFTIFFLLTAIVNSQVNLVWQSNFNGPGNGWDYPYSMVLDNAGNIYITGESANGVYYDCVTIKYNSSGVEQWFRTFNGSGNSTDFGKSIAIDASGNVYVAGQTTSASGLRDYLVIKYNSTGIQQWVRTYNGTGNANDNAFSIAVDASGNVYVTGEASASVSFDFITIKYNSAGVEQWVRSYNGPGNNWDAAASLALDAAGNVYVTGFSRSSSNTNSGDYATIKYNSDGVQQWVSRFNGPANTNDFAYFIKVDPSGNAYVTGQSQGDFLTIKYNTSGAEQWASRYNSPENAFETPKAMAIDASGNVYITGQSNLGLGTEDYATVKYNTAGIEQWGRIYNGPMNNTDAATSIAVDDSGKVFVTGTSLVITGNEMTTIHYNPLGVEQWVQRTPSAAVGNSIALDAAGNIFVTGYGTIANADIITVMYTPVIAINQIGIEIPNAFSLSQNYPNPFNPVTNIEFAVPKSGFVKLSVLDLTGRELEILVNQNMKAGTYMADWDASKYSSGVYFYTITSESFRETKKMILIK